MEGASDIVPSKEMETLGVEKEGDFTVEEAGTGAGDVGIGGVFADGGEGVLVLREIVPQADKVKVRGDIDHGMSLCHSRPTQLRQRLSNEILEPGFVRLGEGACLDAVKVLLDEGDDVDDGSVGVRLGDFDFASDVAGELFEEGVDFGGEEVREHEGLADVFGAAVKAPVADAGEVAPVRVLRDHVHVFKHRLNIVGNRVVLAFMGLVKRIIQKHKKSLALPPSGPSSA